MSDQRLVIIQNNADLKKALAEIESAEYLTFDTETTGVKDDSEIIGYSFCADPGVGYYVITSYWDREQQKLEYLETVNTASETMEVFKKKQLIMHNAPFDCRMVKSNYGVELIGSVHTDTMILAHLLNENRAVGLKELGVSLFGEDAKAEQIAMKESVIKNGGELTRKNYELYKADADIIAAYGAKDAILTLKIFLHLVPELFEQGLDQFFYEDESMPLLRGPTYHLNTGGLKVDGELLRKTEKELEIEILQQQHHVTEQISHIVKEEYPGTNKKNTFNMNSPAQMSWLMFVKLGNTFRRLNDTGKKWYQENMGKSAPYSAGEKRAFIKAVQQCKDAKGNPMRPEKMIKCDKQVLTDLARKYDWVKVFLKYKANSKMLKTYVRGINDKVQYGVIHPSFLQHGTTSGRYSSKAPNFQNLPRTDKRIKKFITARPGKVFVGADYSQLEPRVFASFSKDERLLKCFKDKEDFYSVVGIPVFGKFHCKALKEGPGSFGEMFPTLRDISKGVALSATYGTTAYKLADTLRHEDGMNLSPDEAQKVIDDYFAAYPSVQLLMLESHAMVKRDGFVKNLFGRPRRIPEALKIGKYYKNYDHDELPYELRNLLNLAVNHRIQSTGASIVNRAAIAFLRAVEEEQLDCRLVLQVHDELVAEAAEKDAPRVAELMKFHMETTVTLPGVALEAVPKIAKNLADLK